MFRKIFFVALCAPAFLSPAFAQQYQAPATANLTGGGVAPANEAVGGGLSQPPQSNFGEEYTIPAGGGTSASSSGTGGGVNEAPYSSYGSDSVTGISGGGLNGASQGSTGSRPAALAPNGETYRSLGIQGY